MSENTYDSVWDALENTPEGAENMRLRSRLMMALADQIKTQRWTQKDAAERLHVTQPRISDLTRGKVDLFGLDALVNMAATAGLRVEMHVLETGNSRTPYEMPR